MAQNLTQKALKCLRAGGLAEAKMLIKEGWYVVEMTNRSITWMPINGNQKYTQLFVL